VSTTGLLSRAGSRGQRERAVLAGLIRGDQTAAEMEELERLADTAGAEVVGTLLQHRGVPHPATFLGKGKLEELHELAANESADLVIVNGEMSPAQQRNVERTLDLKVIDRTALVLDIFAQRARTREGRLQVQLAQLTYLLPRLAGRGVMLSRLGGGIGTRGPGETKLEVDRRRIRDQITVLRREIAEIGRHRSLQRRSRTEAHLPTVALVGYTNAGKSTLLNTLTDAGVFVEDKLFATLDPTIRKATLPNDRPVLLVDTVGFITRLPTQLIAAFRATLEEVTEADLLIHVIDGSHPNWKAQRKAVERVLGELGAGDTPVVYAVNKTDLLPAAQARAVAAAIGEGVPISALHGVGLINLLRKVAQELPEPLVRIKLTLPYAKAQALSQIFAEGRVLKQDYTARGINIEAELPRVQAKQLKAALRSP
jgi:GTP-binding protein HflX